MIGMTYLLMFFTKNRQQNYIAMTTLQSGGIFEVLGRCSLRVMTPASIQYPEEQCW